MITLFRFLTFILMAAYSGAMIAALIYHFRLVGDHKGWVFDFSLYSEALIWAGLAVIALIILGVPILAGGVIRLFFPVRRLSLREEARVFPALNNVIHIYKDKFGRDMKIKVMAMDVPGIDGMAVGSNTIALSTGLLKVGSDEEIAAGIAHELGHLHYKDSVFRLVMLVASLPVLFFLLPATLFSGDSKDEPQKNKKPSSDGDPVVNYLILILFGTIVYFFPVFVALWFGAMFFTAILYSVGSLTDWPVEYRADRFAMNLGLGASLTSLLENFEDEDIRSKEGFLQNYAYTHPPIALRIDKLERALLNTAQAASS